MPVVAAVLTMSAAQLFDLATFWTMVHRLGPGAEVNPLVALLFGAYGYPLVAIAKVVLLAVVTAVGAILLKRAKTDRKSTRLNSSHPSISYAVFCLKKKRETKLIKFMIGTSIP